jgi:hypothetical protein
MKDRECGGGWIGGERVRNDSHGRIGIGVGMRSFVLGSIIERLIPHFVLGIRKRIVLITSLVETTYSRITCFAIHF